MLWGRSTSNTGRPRRVTTPMSIGNCDTLADREYDGHDCQFYDVCREIEVDCREELGRMTGTTFLDTARFGNVVYTSVDVPADAPRNDAGRVVHDYHSERFNCGVVEIVTASRAAALPFAKAVGFYYGGDVSGFTPDALTKVGSVTLANGEAGVLHTFGALSLCWAGSMSSSGRQVDEFKPFMLFEHERTCYVSWDAVPSNYRFDVHTRSFDRSGEVLRQAQRPK